MPLKLMSIKRTNNRFATGLEILFRLLGSKKRNKNSISNIFPFRFLAVSDQKHFLTVGERQHIKNFDKMYNLP